MSQGRVSILALKEFTASALRRLGLSAADASTGAEALVTTDAWGVFTHGTKCLAGYLRRLKAGGLRPGGRPRIAAESGAWATVDGDSALGMVASVFGMRTAIAKAREVRRRAQHLPLRRRRLLRLARSAGGAHWPGDGE